MSLTLNVLLSSGAQKRVVISNTHSVSEVVEEVCKSQNLDPDFYDLRYKNQVLSISSALNCYQIPNHAQLSLVRLSKKRELSSVAVTLQMENGERHTAAFNPTDTLWDIINVMHGDTLNESEIPAILYVRRKISGDELKVITLKSLGYISGNVLFRLIMPEKETSAPPLKKAKELKDHNPSRKTENKIELENTQINNEIKDGKIDEVKQPEGNASTMEIINEKENSSIKTDDKMKIKADNKTEITDDNKMEIIDDDKMEIGNITNVTNKTDENESPMEVEADQSKQDSDSTCPKSSSEESDAQSFVTQQYIDEIKYIGVRYALLFHFSTMSTPKFKDPSDDFFNLTIDDAKSLLREAKQTRRDLEEGELSTAAIRQKRNLERMEKLLNRYPHCVVRIQFPNRLILQGVFASNENVGDIKNFVKDFLKDPDADFFLYTTPPKNILESKMKLYDLGLPGVIVYFGTKGGSVNSSINTQLKDDVTKNLISSDIAQNVANFFRKRNDIEQKIPLIVPGAEETRTNNNSNSDKSKGNSSRQRNHNNTSSTLFNKSKVPKWFKRLF